MGNDIWSGFRFYSVFHQYLIIIGYIKESYQDFGLIGGRVAIAKTLMKQAEYVTAEKTRRAEEARKWKPESS